MVTGLSETPEKRRKVESAEPCTPQLLTRENLALLEDNMAGNKRKGTEGDSGTLPTSEPSPTSDKSLREMSEVLRVRGVKENDPNTKNAPLVTRVRSWVVGDRNSKMSVEEAGSFEAARIKHKERVEAVFIERVWCLLLLQTRTVKRSGDDDMQNNDELVRKAWEADYLDWTIDEPFYPDSIPKIDATGDPVLAALLKELPKMQIPKPDRAYGLEENAFTEEERNINLVYKHITRAARSVYHTFFIIEFKSFTGVMAEAQLQARRSGACLMSCLRRFKNLAGILNEATSQDNGSFVFSLAMIPIYAELNIHWAVLEPNGKVTYHMHLLKAYLLTDAEHVINLRRDVDNVLDWGLSIRLDYIKDCLAKIKARDPKFKQPGSLGSAGSVLGVPEHSEA